ncbi:hypothetical protein J3B02_004208, partial [Coemansia erecta]
MSVSRFRKESDMYPCITALFRYVEDAIDRSSAADDIKRRLKVYSKSDATPDGADDYRRIDIGLTFKRKLPDDDVNDDASDELDELDELNEPNYNDMLAVIEAKRLVSEQTRAYQQMYIYTRNVYPEQHNRQFVWGFTFCASVVRACILGHDNVFSSLDMDVSTDEGLKAFVKLAVDMTFCESDQLGYDPNISYNLESDRWEIAMYDEKSQQQVIYHLRYVAQNADRVFGRHTRCFICREIKPLPEDENENENENIGSDDNNNNGDSASYSEAVLASDHQHQHQHQHDKNDFLIKDAWPHAETSSK